MNPVLVVLWHRTAMDKKCLIDPTNAIFWKAWGPRTPNMTFPCVNPIQLGPSPFNSQCKKSSLHHHFRRNSRKLGSQKLQAEAHFWCTSRCSCFPLLTSPGGIFGQKCEASNTQKNDRKWPHMSQKWQKMHCEMAEPPTEIQNRKIISVYFLQLFTRYGRLKLKFLCEQFSHCIL